MNYKKNILHVGVDGARDFTTKEKDKSATVNINDLTNDALKTVSLKDDIVWYPDDIYKKFFKESDDKYQEFLTKFKLTKNDFQQLFKTKQDFRNGIKNFIQKFHEMVKTNEYHFDPVLVATATRSLVGLDYLKMDNLVYDLSSLDEETFLKVFDDYKNKFDSTALFAFVNADKVNKTITVTTPNKSMYLDEKQKKFHTTVEVRSAGKAKISLIENLDEGGRKRLNNNSLSQSQSLAKVISSNISSNTALVFQQTGGKFDPVFESQLFSTEITEKEEKAKEIIKGVGDIKKEESSKRRNGSMSPGSAKNVIDKKDVENKSVQPVNLQELAKLDVEEKNKKNTKEDLLFYKNILLNSDEEELEAVYKEYSVTVSKESILAISSINENVAVELFDSDGAYVGSDYVPFENISIFSNEILEDVAQENDYKKDITTEEFNKSLAKDNTILNQTIIQLKKNKESFVLAYDSVPDGENELNAFNKIFDDYNKYIKNENERLNINMPLFDYEKVMAYDSTTLFEQEINNLLESLSSIVKDIKKQNSKPNEKEVKLEDNTSNKNEDALIDPEIYEALEIAFNNNDLKNIINEYKKINPSLDINELIKDFPGYFENKPTLVNDLKKEIDNINNDASKEQNSNESNTPSKNSKPNEKEVKLEDNTSNKNEDLLNNPLPSEVALREQSKLMIDTFLAQKQDLLNSAKDQISKATELFKQNIQKGSSVKIALDQIDQEFKNPFVVDAVEKTITTEIQLTYLKDESIKNLREELGNKADDIKNYEKKSVSYEETITNLNKDKEQLKTTHTKALDKISEEVDKLLEEKVNLEKSVSELNEKISLQEELITELEKDILNEQEYNKSFKAKEENYIDRIATLEEALKQKDTLAHDYKTSNELLRENLEELQVELTKAKDYTKSLEERNNLLVKKLETTKEIGAEVTQASKLESQNSNIQSGIDFQQKKIFYSKKFTNNDYKKAFDEALQEDVNSLATARLAVLVNKKIDLFDLRDKMLEEDESSYSKWQKIELDFNDLAKLGVLTSEKPGVFSIQKNQESFLYLNHNEALGHIESEKSILNKYNNKSQEEKSLSSNHQKGDNKKDFKNSQKNKA